MEPVVPDTKVLAIASHVVYGYVGNKMAAFVMQALGCDVSALNTVQFSNHTGYKQFKGTRGSYEELSDLYVGLDQSYLNDFDIMLTGYAASAEAVEVIGKIGRHLKTKASSKPGSFFWVLDPVMGDEGRLYVNENVVPVHKENLRDADLILPNQFEAELLSSTKISSLPTLCTAIRNLHRTYHVPHIVITSVRLPLEPNTISIIGSTARSDFTPRLFRITVPTIDCFFSGTGDMFAALTVVRLREAVTAAGLAGVKSWLSPDVDERGRVIPARELPLARACEKVLGSMHAVLVKTKEARDREVDEWKSTAGKEEVEDQKVAWLRGTRAAEVKVVRHQAELREPEVEWKAVALDVDVDGGEGEVGDEVKSDGQ